MKILLFLLFILVSEKLLAQNVFPSTGNVGIGTATPGAKISFNEVNDGSDGADGITWYSPSALSYGIYRTPGTWSPPSYQQLKFHWDTGIIINPGTAHQMSYVDIQGGGLRITSGNVGIGTTTPNEKLAVNGKIRAHEIKVETENWPDYVFDQDYKILRLQEVEAYIKVNKHLPEMPSAKEVEVNGVELGEMNKLLLKKVEELTLYLIEKEKEIKLERAINANQNERLRKLESKLNKP